QQLVSLPVIFSFVFTPPPPPRSTLFPYTTLFRSGLGRQTLHLHEVLLLLLETRMGDTVLQPAVVGEQQQPLAVVVQPPGRIHVRSEEHTSELQSRENLVCRLLLEKKNNASTQTER